MNCYLYRHFDHDGRLLYVGISLRVLSRLDQHRMASLWFERIANVTIEKFGTRDDAKEAERIAIQLEEPLFNVIHAAPLNEGMDERRERKWNLILDAEPRVWSLFMKAVKTWKIDNNSPFCANKIWFDEIKPRLCELVGFHAEDKRLQSAELYNVAYQTIYYTLPDCRHCSDFGCS